MSTRHLFENACEILRENDRGAYTVPTHGLYPFQWNWDSCLTALGQRHMDEARAWLEIQTLLEHQWPDGMVPHIVFHQKDDGYFPGPDVWSCNRPTPTSGITQPPVLGFVLRRLYEEAGDRPLAETQIRTLLPKALEWHRWFFRCRDPQGTGLVALLHPWEAGRDNSVDWDSAFQQVPTEGVAPYVRRDTQHVNAAQRPTQAEYDRYLWLVQHFRSLGWNNTRLHDASPFQVIDPGFNAILLRSEEDLAWLAERLGEAPIVSEICLRMERTRAAFEQLWNETAGQYQCLDRKTGKRIDSLSVAGVLPLLAAVGTPEQRRRMAERLGTLRQQVSFGVPSHAPADPRFDARRYWRGPVWLIINYMLTDGLQRHGFVPEARQILQDSLALIESSGFAEYYDPTDGAPCGGKRFTWTAAMVLEFLKISRSLQGA